MIILDNPPRVSKRETCARRFNECPCTSCPFTKRLHKESTLVRTAVPSKPTPHDRIDTIARKCHLGSPVRAICAPSSARRDMMTGCHNRADWILDRRNASTPCAAERRRATQTEFSTFSPQGGRRSFALNRPSALKSPTAQALSRLQVNLCWKTTLRVGSSSHLRNDRSLMGMPASAGRNLYLRACYRCILQI